MAENSSAISAELQNHPIRNVSALPGNLSFEVDELQVSEDIKHCAFASLYLSSSSFELERNEWEGGLGKEIAVKK